MRHQISRILTREQVMKLSTGNCSQPKNVLGRHLLEQGQVIAAFHPGVVRMTLRMENEEAYPMDMVERQPVFALFLPHRQTFSYQIEMEYGDGRRRIMDDPYRFGCQITREEEEQFLQGRWLDAYHKMGAHPMTIGGVEGTYFALWAPGIKRVSVLGEFNHWNPALYPMNRMEHTDIYELFLPGVQTGENYCFEIKTIQDRTFRTADPFEMAEEPGKRNISKILNINETFWEDGDWMKDRKRQKRWNSPLIIGTIEEGAEEMEDMLQDTCTHILISQQKKDLLRQQEMFPGQCFLPPRCAGSPEHFHAMIEKAHRNGIGVLLELSWNRRSLVCDEVKNFFLSSLLFWAREYHVDGFLFRDMRRVTGDSLDTSNDIDIYNARCDSLAVAHGSTGSEMLKQAAGMLRQEEEGVLFILGEEEIVPNIN